MTRTLKAVVEEWLEERENAEDCSCEGDDPAGGCWFRLTAQQKTDARVQSLREKLEAEPEEVL